MNALDDPDYNESNSDLQEEIAPLVDLPDDDLLPALSAPGLSRYLREIGQYKLLTREEVEALSIKFHEEGDQDAAYQLVTANLRLVVKVAMDFQKYWMTNFLDLVQEGNIGLVMAVKKFDPYRGVKFSYYAAYWIRAYILKFIMDNWRLVKIGTTQAQRKLFFSLNKEKTLLEVQGFQPELKLLAQRLNVKEKDVVEMTQRMEFGDSSLETPLRDGSNDQQKDLVLSGGPSVEDKVSSREIKQRIAAVLERLHPRLNSKELTILADRLLSDEPLTLQEIADRFGISRERVRQIEANLLHKMRKIFDDELPEISTFLEEAVDFWRE